MNLNLNFFNYNYRINKSIAVLCLTIAGAFCCRAQSIDEKIGNAINTSDWFALDSIYSVSPKDSINPFLEVFSRCLVGNRLNRPDVSIPAFQELLNTQSQNLGLGNLVSTAHMFGMDLSRMGYNAEAASMVNSILAATKQYLDSSTVATLTDTAKRYTALSKFKPYMIEFPDSTIATVTFSIVPVGPADKGAVLMHLQKSFINGVEADITFDTGAGSNTISIEMAKKLNLIPLEDSKITVKGIENRDGYVAVAKVLKMGDIIVRDVPFTVISLSSENEEADRYINSFNIVVGSELMLQLKDLTIDFTNNHITVPTTQAKRVNVRPNLCFSSTMNLLADGRVLSTPMLMCLDTGDSSFGSLGYGFFEDNKEYVVTHGAVDTIREAGVGGIRITECYKVPNFPVSIGGNTVFPPEFAVKSTAGAMIADYNCIIGVKTLMRFAKVRFNLVDFLLTTENS